MSGHSKWHNIRLKKGRADQIRGKLFSKLAREISVAAKEGGGNPDGNARLRTAMERGREAGMPSDNIERAIQRGTGQVEGASYETITYEGYAQGGVALMVETLTDNRNRTASEIRNVFTNNGGAMSEAGSVAWMFDRKGLITVDRSKATEDDVLVAALEAGAEDVRSVGDIYEIVTTPEQFYRVRQALEAAKIPVASSDLTMVPKSTVRVEGKEAQQVLRLMEALEEHDDVQQAYANFDIPDEILQQVG